MNHGKPRSNYTIGQFMVATAFVSLLLAGLAGPQNFRGIAIIVGGLGLLTIIGAVILALVDVFLSVGCPVCSQWAMSRQSVASFRDRFYLCTSCGAKLRRGFLRGWDDASSPEFDAIYKRKRPENPWTAPPHVDDGDLVFSKTHVNLLLNKQRRNPNPPDQHAGRNG